MGKSRKGKSGQLNNITFLLHRLVLAIPTGANSVLDVQALFWCFFFNPYINIGSYNFSNLRIHQFWTAASTSSNHLEMWSCSSPPSRPCIKWCSGIPQESGRKILTIPEILTRFRPSLRKRRQWRLKKTATSSRSLEQVGECFNKYKKFHSVSVD